MSTLFINPFLVVPATLAKQLAGAETQALALDFTDTYFQAASGHYGSAYVKDTGTPANNYDSTPYGLLNYTSPSAKMTMGPAGTLRFGAHNLYLNSASPANQSITVVSGATYSVDITGSVSVTASGAASGTWTSGSNTFTAATTTLTLGSTSGSGTVVVRRTPSDSTYLATTSDARYALPFEWGSNLASGLATQDVTVEVHSAANPRSYAVNFEGSGSVTLSGAASSAVVAGTPTHVRPSTTTLTLTISGSVTKLDVRQALGLLVEEARTNLCLYSDDLTNAAWTKSNLTTAKTATGPDGVANSATTCTATAGNATALQAITSGSASRISSCWIKRRTGSGTVNVTQDNGSTWTAVTVTSSWTRVEIPAATLANPTVGIRIVTSGDAVDVALFQHEVGSFVTSAIPTLGASVTRAADDISVATSAFPYDKTTGTAFAQLTLRTADSVASGTPILWVSGNGRQLYFNTDQLRAFDGVNAPNPTVTTTSGATYAAASAWGSDLAVVVNGGSVAVTAFDGDMEASPSTLGIGNGSGASVVLTGHVKKLMCLPRRMANADMQALTS